MRVSYKIPNMSCSACVMHLEALEDKLDGIVYVKANYRQQRMEVEFDETRIAEQKIRAEVAELGYEIAN